MYTSTNRCKHYLKVHMIFICKYRRKVLIDNFAKSTKFIFKDIAQMSDFNIETMEVDKDHIHFLIEYLPRTSIASICNRLKSLSTNRLWKIHEPYLRKFYWYENLLWSDGYFACSVGEASAETIRNYIQNQG